MLADHHTLHLVHALVDLGEAGDSSTQPNVPILSASLSLEHPSFRLLGCICRDEVGMEYSFSIEPIEPIARPVIGQRIWPATTGFGSSDTIFVEPIGPLESCDFMDSGVGFDFKIVKMS